MRSWRARPVVVPLVFSYSASVNHTALPPLIFQDGGYTPSFLFILFTGANRDVWSRFTFVAALKCVPREFLHVQISARRPQQIAVFMRI